MKKRINTETEVVHNERVNSLFESSPNQEFLRFFFFTMKNKSILNESILILPNVDRPIPWIIVYFSKESK